MIAKTDGLTDDQRESINAAMDELDAARNEVGLYTAAQQWPQVRRALDRLERAVERCHIAMDEADLPLAEGAR
jgi:hypothetical protein